MADFWRYEIGVNVIPADTKNKIPLVEWKPYQNAPDSEPQHNQWKQEDMFAKGMAIIVEKSGTIPRKKGCTLTSLIWTIKRQLTSFARRVMSPLPLVNWQNSLLIEQHSDDPTRAHVFCYSTKPFKKKGRGSRTVGSVSGHR